MLHWLFTTGQEIAVQSAPPAIVLGVSAPLVAAIILTRERQQGITIAHMRRDRIMRIVASALAALGTFHILLLALGQPLREGSSRPNLGPAEMLATFFIGPPTSSRFYLLVAGVLTAGCVILSAKAAYSLTRDAGSLREYIGSLYLPTRKRGELGSAQFCTVREFRCFSVPDVDGLAFRGAYWGQGRWARRLCRLDRGDHGLCLSGEDVARGILAIGGPGSGKTQSVILPAIADWMAAGRSVIVVDPQNELASYIKHFAAVTRHQVIIHDPTSDVCPRFNLASGIRNVSEARAIASVLLPIHDDQEGENFWRESAQALLAACLLRFENIGQILLELAEPRRLARRLAEKEGDSKLLATPFIVSMKGDGRLAAQIAAALATALTGWADQIVRSATATSDFSAATLIECPTVIVLISPSRQRTTYARYLGSVLRKMLLDLDSIGEANGGPLPVPVAMVVDEFPTLGKLDGLISDVNLVRKRRIAILIAAQTKGQFHLIYGKSATDALFAGLATQIVFGGCDQETADFYSRASGVATEILPTWLGQPPQIRQRSLLTPDEIQSPARGNATICARYVSEVNASQVIAFARLTRLYERIDWQDKLGRVNPEDAYVIQRLSEGESPQ